MKALTFLLLPLFIATFHHDDDLQPHTTPMSADSEIRRKDSVFLFKKTDFAIPRNLSGQIFLENTYFSNSTFNTGVNFSTSYFKKDAVFANVSFKNFVDFSGATFLKDLNFSSAKFHKFLFLSGIFTDSVTDVFFYNASLPDLIDFSHNTSLYRTVDFTNANFDSLERENTNRKDKIYFINIYNTDISKIKLGYIHFKMCFYDPEKTDKDLTSLFENLKKEYVKNIIVSNKVIKTWDKQLVYSNIIKDNRYVAYIADVFPSAKMTDDLVIDFTHFYVDMGSFPARLYEDQIDALYSRLLKNFETNGQMDSYKLLDIDYQDYRWSNKSGIVSWFFIFPKYWNFYGHDRELIFAWTIFFLLVFTLISYWSYDNIFVEEGKVKAAYSLKNGPVIPADPKRMRLNKFRCAFIYTSLIFFSFSLKTENVNFKKPAFYYVFTINIFGLLCLAYLANFILQK